MDGGPRVGEMLGRQVDGVSCGPAVLVVTAALTGSARPPDPATARSGAARSTGATSTGATSTSATSTGAAQRLAHRQANRLWPRALGTTPWAMRAWLHRHAPGAARFRIRPATRTVLATVASATRPVPLLIGSRWLPRHWVLVTGTGDDGRWHVYEPGAGVVRAFDPRTFDDGTAAAVLGRPRPWCVLLPSP